MKELMSRIKKMEERLYQQTKQSSESVRQSNFPDSYSNQYVPGGCGRAGYRNNLQRGGYGRGYQGSSIHNNYNSESNYNNAHQSNFSKKKAIEVEEVLGVVAVVVPTAVVLTMVKMLGTI